MATHVVFEVQPYPVWSSFSVVKASASERRWEGEREVSIVNVRGWGSPAAVMRETVRERRIGVQVGSKRRRRYIVR